MEKEGERARVKEINQKNERLRKEREKEEGSGNHVNKREK
jgi:hypothetical protein